MKKQIISLLIVFFSLSFSNTHSSDYNWKPAQDGDKIIWIRHALAPGGGDPLGFKIKDCKTQRNLNEKGINQSKKIGKLFKKKKVKIDKVFSSQWCRCKDTAKYAFGNFNEFSALNSTFSAPFDKNEKKQIKELNNFIKNWNGKGKNLILVTHYVVILAMTGETSSSGELIITDKDLKILSKIKTF